MYVKNLCGHIIFLSLEYATRVNKHRRGTRPAIISNTMSTPQELHIAVFGCGKSVKQNRRIKRLTISLGFIGTAFLRGILVAAAGWKGKSRIAKLSATVRSQGSITRIEEALIDYRDTVELTLDSENTRVAREADVAILAFKPQDLESFSEIPEMKDALKDKLIISLLAGRSCEQILKVLYGSLACDTVTSTREYRVAQVIPSIGAQINESITLIADTTLASADKDCVSWIFSQLGRVEFFPEKLLNTATALSAACHALVAVAVDAAVDGAVSEGIERSVALNVVAQSLRSSSSLLLDGMSVERFKESMSVPYGITINAILQLEHGQARCAISDAVRHAARYASKMSSTDDDTQE